MQTDFGVPRRRRTNFDDIATLPYEYKPLPEPGRYIRLLTLVSARDKDSPIITRLSHHPLPPPDGTQAERFRLGLRLPPYIAISYVWGAGPDLERNHFILVDGRRFPVSKRVHDAFRVFRAYSTASTRYWIDCICINQTDVSERSHQIPLMPDIYALSLWVLVWLGNPTPESEKVTRYINKLTQHPTVVKLIDIFIDLRPAQVIWAHDTPIVVKLWETLWNWFVSIVCEISLRLSLRFVWFISIIADVFSGRRSRKLAGIYRYCDLEHYSSLSLGDEFHINWKGSARKSRVGAIQRIAADDEGMILNLIDLWDRIAPAALWSTLLETYEDKMDNSRAIRRTALHDGVRKNGLASQLKPVPSTLWRTLSEAYWRCISELRARRRATAISQVNDMHNQARAWYRTKERSSSTWTPSAACLRSVSMDNPLEMSMLMESTLFSRTQYFGRVWTLQESSVAKQVVIADGRTMLLLKDLFKVMHYHKHSLGFETTNIEKAVRLQWIAAEFRSLRRLPLIVLLYETRDRRCKNPRDRIYGLLGLMHGQLSVLLQPDYDQSVAEVYANATRFIIATERKLNIICGHEPSSTIADLPSWTPDYTCFATSGATPLVDLSGRLVIHTASLKEPPPQLPDPSISPINWHLLPVSGIFLGTITQLSRESAPDEPVKTRQQKWNVPLISHFAATPGAVSALAKLTQLIDLYSDYHASRLHGKFWDTRPAEFSSLGTLTTSLLETPPPAKLLWTKYLVTLFRGYIAGGGPRMKGLMARATQRDAAGDAAIEKMHEVFLAGMRYRRLFTTDEDDVWGAAPNRARVGDHIFVLVGCSVPVVLRKLPDEAEYQLVGGCFCDAYMTGAALKRRDEDVKNVEDIVLR